MNSTDPILDAEQSNSRKPGFQNTLLAIGVVMSLVGMVFRLMHWPASGLLLSSGFSLTLGCGIGFLLFKAAPWKAIAALLFAAVLFLITRGAIAWFISLPAGTVGFFLTYFALRSKRQQ